MVGKSPDTKGQDADGAAGCLGRQRCYSGSSTAPSASLLAACLLSALSIACCAYLGMKTSDLQARVSAIEAAQGDISVAPAAAAATYHPLLASSSDQLNALMQDKVERLLAQIFTPKSGFLNELCPLQMLGEGVGDGAHMSKAQHVRYRHLAGMKPKRDTCFGNPVGPIEEEKNTEEM
ncbi:Collagen alpha-1(XXV) chain [Varanus komodoensis]|nr:Collagen alpha-1(XXV) chain [Varanus komodoensis]